MKTLSIALLLTMIIVSANGQDATRVKISTDFGDMIIKLYDDTPNHKANFIKNVKDGLYDGTMFHRIIPWFMAQGGDPKSKNATTDQALGADNCIQLDAEIRPNRYHKKGALAAARLPDNINPDKKSSGCQFFIVQGYKHNDEQLNNLELQGKLIPPKRKAVYKGYGGYPFLDGDYTIFGEVIDGIEIVDIFGNMQTGDGDRPVEALRMTVTML